MSTALAKTMEIEIIEITEYPEDDRYEPFIQLAVQMQRDSNYREATVNLDKARENLRAWIASPHFLVALAKNGDQMLGAVLGDVFSPWWTDEIFGRDKLIFVNPALEGHGIGTALYEYLLSWTTRKGAKVTYCATSTGIGTEAAIRIFQKMGLRQHALMYTGET
jgi:GNAT superfamily N-acetyltransferase|tara:strand:+ start:3242 stop:3733 length:492 start_codon:yes stop_codon:yes gene_type:complete